MTKVVYAVDVRIFVGTKPFPVEHYNLFHWAEINAMKANMATYPSQIIKSYKTNLTDGELFIYELIRSLARAKAGQEYQPLRKSA